MNYTENYQLPQWVESDRVLMEDFNTANSKIDAVLSEAVRNMATKGNCQIYTTSYTGNGISGFSNYRSLSFPGTPLVVMIAGDGPNGMTALRGVTSVRSTLDANVNLSWSGSTLSWAANSAQGQMNTDGEIYQVVALLAK